MREGLHVVLVTGMSGAGRSTAIHVLEDLGFFCVDNLPPKLAPDLVRMLDDDDRIRRIGLGVDVRTGAFLDRAVEVLDDLRGLGHEVEILFLDASDEALIRRFSETRRPHPMAISGDLPAAIQSERERLGPLRALAQQTFDTTNLTVHDLRRALVDHVARSGGRPRMVTRVLSFGFKYGLPTDADLVFDLRYLPNPHFVPELRPKTGLDDEVAHFVLDTDEAKDLLEHLMSLLTHTIPRYEREGKAYLTIAVGCTGGRHRSVAMSEEVGRRLRDGREVTVAHRDVDRKSR